AAGSTEIAGDITTSGHQIYNDAVTLGADTALTSGGGGNIAFASTLDGRHHLTINSSGTTTFGGVVGSTDALASLTTNAAGSTTIAGGAITTIGDQHFADAVVIDSSTHATALSGANVTFGSTVRGAADGVEK